MNPTLVATISLAFTIATGIIGVVYQMGRLSARVESLEAWRGEIKMFNDRLFDELRAIRALIAGEGK